MKPVGQEQPLPSAKPTPGSHSDGSPTSSPSLSSALQPGHAYQSTNMICIKPAAVTSTGSHVTSLRRPHSLTLQPAGQAKASGPTIPQPQGHPLSRADSHSSGLNLKITPSASFLSLPSPGGAPYLSASLDKNLHEAQDQYCLFTTLFPGPQSVAKTDAEKINDRLTVYTGQQK